MHSSRSPLTPTPGIKRRRSPPSTNDYGIPSAHPSQTSLPSFKQLEPYLRPHNTSTDQYPYYDPHIHTPQEQQHLSATSSQIMPLPQRDSGIYATADSELDDVDHHGPPKKKRRRQALSCTGDFSTFLPPSHVPHLLSPLPLTRNPFLSILMPIS